MNCKSEIHYDKEKGIANKIISLCFLCPMFGINPFVNGLCCECYQEWRKKENNIKLLKLYELYQKLYKHNKSYFLPMKQLCDVSVKDFINTISGLEQLKMLDKTNYIDETTNSMANSKPSHVKYRRALIRELPEKFVYRNRLTLKYSLFESVSKNHDIEKLLSRHSAEASCVQQCYWYKYHRREHHSVNKQIIPVM